MLSRHPLLLITLAALAVAIIIWSCDRLDGDVSANQPPHVEFINVPLDSSQFNFAPTVYWFGYDPDGLITAYQYADDQSDAAVAAYRAGDAELMAYISNLPTSAWTTTERTQETIYLLTAEGDTAEHVFIVRSVDNRGAYSSPKVRIFFRTNQAPNTPEVRKVAIDDWDNEADSLNYQVNLTLQDTLFIGERTSSTWPGIQFVWRGTDPDSRELNIIPLTFSYRLTNTTTGLVVPYRRISGDTSNIDTTWIYDWSDWTDDAQVIYSGQYPNMDAGDYLFEVRVRDDGLTLSDTNATATFIAIRPTFEKQLLIVDENKRLAGPDRQRGGYSDSLIMAFYYNVIPQAFEIAEDVRQRDFPEEIPDPFSYDPSQVELFENKDLSQNRYIPYDYIHRFKWVWIIDDDNGGSAPGFPGVDWRQKSMGRYMDVGGQVMISGRKIFFGSYNATDVSSGYGSWFRTYFNLQSIAAKTDYSVADADFGGAETSIYGLPDVRVDSAVTCSLQFGSNRFCCPPQIDYFGRMSRSSGYNYAETMYNYISCSANQSYYATNIDCYVISSSPTQAILQPDPTHTRILEATRAYNATLGVSGEIIDVRNDNGWQIVVSTPLLADQTVTNYDSPVRPDTNSTQFVLLPVGCMQANINVTRVYNATLDVTGTVSGVQASGWNWQIVVSAPVANDQSVVGGDLRVVTVPNPPSTQAILAADTACLRNLMRIREVTRVYNSTKAVYGEVDTIRYSSTRAQWEIVVITPDPPGRWVDSDVLEVDYTYTPRWSTCDILQVDYTYTPRWTPCDVLEVDYSYIPISMNHDQPIGARFIRIEGTLIPDPQNGRVRFVGDTKFRTALFTFPFCFLDTTHVDIPLIGTDLNPVSAIIAQQLLFFNAPRQVEVGGGGD